MSQLVRVTPSVSGYGGASGHPPAAAADPRRSGGRKSSKEFDLMNDEVEEFSCEYKTTGRVTEGYLVRLGKKIKYYMTCQCICKCYVPVHTWSVQVLVTNRRLILREVMHKKEPGIKKCCYYATCLCCCPTEVDSGYEEQFCIERKDIKDYAFKVTHENSETSCLCCLCSKRAEEAFSAKVFLSKTVLESRRSWLNWSIDKDLKTYTAVREIAGLMPKSDSLQLRQMLHTITAQNAAAGSAPSAGASSVGVLQKELRTEPVELRVNLN